MVYLLIAVFHVGRRHGFPRSKIIQEKLHGINSHGIYGYYGDYKEYNNSIKWWMKNRHNWEIDTSWIFTTHGLVNGTGLCIDAFTNLEMV